MTRAQHVEVLARAQALERAQVAGHRARVGADEDAAVAEHGVAGEARPVGDQREVVGRVAGSGDRLEGAEANAFGERHVDLAAPGRDRRRVALRAAPPTRLGVVGVVVGERDAAEPAARVDRRQRARSRCASSAGPGSTTQAGARPTTQVFVPDSVNGPGLGARSRATSWPLSCSSSGRGLARAPVAARRVPVEAKRACVRR